MTTRRAFTSVLALGGFAVATSFPDLRPARAQEAGGAIERIKASGKLRTAAIPGAEPFFHKDLLGGGWAGACIDMVKDMASALGATPEIVEAEWGTSVMDLQTGKIDVMFALSPTPARALQIQFSDIAINNAFTVIAKKGLPVGKWEDLDKPEIRVAFDTGSSHDIFVRRALPHCTPVAVQSPTDAIMALQAGRADCVVQVVVIAAVMHARNPGVGDLILPQPVVHQPTCIGVPVSSDPRFLTFVNNWLLYNRSEGIVQEWMFKALRASNVDPASLPPGLEF
ncbi:ABC transporter substrate-binding protein [Gluconacetobacter liquefaciens]|uniref:Amino acid ABC transporter substrate-binding protein (PAAT family) n=1 Tax=Gluconacetobacter liquefaciens TaxID=89584 RepID=A0A370GFU1_GLULI|nr:transporter substrate-binding domain-containing protein [Gluconacetobacter liquefaciens]MBB2185407.1 transporter substrate-binding domain-containing protein [Gluconacetobacter liquefaciens]RDI40853.1 amino acid ABC transporter substrate-binding protein (PAAT family) [Gluconacetobacter liquefaciens]GEB39318.1 ABC transporter substrate-binding protein [Gluconacetobacter liquefaciens]